MGWLALGVIAMTVLLVILDATIVNIALPAVSADLEIDAATRRSLELLRTLSGEKRGSLLSCIDHTVTGAGARLLQNRL